MAWSYKIDSIVPVDTSIHVCFQVFADGVPVKSDELNISHSSLAGLPSDGRAEYVSQRVADACKKYMVIRDVKEDFSGLIGVEVSLEPIAYETKADVIAREAAQALEAQNPRTI